MPNNPITQMLALQRSSARHLLGALPEVSNDRFAGAMIKNAQLADGRLLNSAVFKGGPVDAGRWLDLAAAAYALHLDALERELTSAAAAEWSRQQVAIALEIETDKRVRSLRRAGWTEAAARARVAERIAAREAEVAPLDRAAQ